MKTAPLLISTLLLAAAPLLSCAHRAERFEARAPVPNPDEARFVTEDIPRFWSAFDSAIDKPEPELAAALQTMYLDPGTPGVEGFTPNRIESAEYLARVVKARRADYDAARANSLAIAPLEPEIRAAFHRLQDLYPDAVFPDVYFVIGALNSGGTSQDMGLLIGMEMSVNQPDTIAYLVTHEAVHYLQKAPNNRNLVNQMIIEGCADYIGALASGGCVNQAALDYARANTADLWRELEPHLNDDKYGNWLYVYNEDKLAGRPPDLGYAMGCLIAEMYYEQAADKQQAIRTLVECRDPRKILDDSGFAERWR